MEVRAIKLGKINNKIAEVHTGEVFIGELLVPSDDLKTFWEKSEKGILHVEIPKILYIPALSFKVDRGYPFMIGPFYRGMRSSKVFDYIIISDNHIKKTGKDRIILPKNFPLDIIQNDFLDKIKPGDMLITTSNSLYLLQKIEDKNERTKTESIAA